tara:strand:+ start:2644 stop:2925 length:282 start_codon:yes stop_codon:yes gene_type:complete
MEKSNKLERPLKLKLKMNKDEGTRVHLYYRPLRHDGRLNIEGKAFAYNVLVHEPFENISRRERFSGFSGVNLENNKWKRFRMDRVVSMTPLVG